VIETTQNGNGLLVDIEETDREDCWRPPQPIVGFDITEAVVID
jgi:hypothetical protein